LEENEQSEQSEQSEQYERQEVPVKQKGHPLKYFKPIVILLLAIMVGFVVWQNTEQMEIHFFWKKVYLPGAVLLATTTAIGFALGVLVSVIVSYRRRPRG
tara:strand:+ start:8819 stop:9118 length:300 start_codon:yes stop_codon:yes gene_type:complete